MYYRTPLPIRKIQSNDTGKKIVDAGPLFILNYLSSVIKFFKLKIN